MSWIIGLFTFLLVIDCLLLILLVLIQLPKKEAGMGQAFGGGATDALFGAGSGTALTKMTKYVTAIFFVLTLSLSVMNAHQNRGKPQDPRKYLTQSDKTPEFRPPATQETNAPKMTNALLSATTNVPAAVTSTPAATPPSTNSTGVPAAEKK